jgi:hypothetical protein
MMMINLVYEYDLTDVDIILAPDFVSDQIERITQQFFSWLSNPGVEHDNWVTNSKGVRCLSCETEGFVKWLNEFILGDCHEKAIILLQHTNVNDTIASAHF